MNVNIDGLRTGLTQDLNRLGNLLEEAFASGEGVCEDILDAFDEAAQNANFLNCVYDNENESFNDLSEKKVKYLTE